MKTIAIAYYLHKGPAVALSAPAYCSPLRGLR